MSNNVLDELRTMPSASSDYEYKRNLEEETKESFWTWNQNQGWYSLSKNQIITTIHRTSRFEDIFIERLVKMLNDPATKDSVLSKTRSGAGTFLCEIEETYTTKDIIQESLPKVDLPPGSYTFERNMNGWGLKPYSFSADEYIPLSKHTDHIEKDIETFLNKKDEYHSRGLLWKRGMLMVGPGGCGKTMILEHLAKKYKDKARIIFGMEALYFLKMFESKIKDLPLIVIAEDFTDHNNQDMLSILDGENSSEVLLIGTSNYAQYIPNNIVDRPGRIDALFEVNLPDDETRAGYLKAKLGSKPTNKIIKATKGLSLAYLRELVIQSQIYNIPFDLVLRGFKERKKKVKKYRSMRENKDADSVWEE